jgi:hypothetical protein
MGKLALVPSFTFSLFKVYASGALDQVTRDYTVQSLDLCRMGLSAVFGRV